MKNIPSGVELSGNLTVDEVKDIIGFGQLDLEEIKALMVNPEYAVIFQQLQILFYEIKMKPLKEATSKEILHYVENLQISEVKKGG